MHRWIAFFNQYAGKRSISDFALIKLCLFSFGLFFGTLAGAGRKKTVRTASAIVFLATYIPLMAGFLLSAPTAEEDEE